MTRHEDFAVRWFDPLLAVLIYMGRLLLMLSRLSRREDSLPGQVRKRKTSKAGQDLAHSLGQIQFAASEFYDR